MDIKSISDSVATVTKASKPKAKGPTRHYPQFSEAEWEVVEKAFGEGVKPLVIKQVILGIATGVLEVRPKGGCVLK